MITDCLHQYLNFTTHFRLYYDSKELSAPNGGSLYQIAYQKNSEAGCEFVVAITHPVSGQVYCIRALLKDNSLTFLNTNKFNLQNIQFYLNYYIQDADLRAKILA